MNLAEPVPLDGMHKNMGLWERGNKRSYGTLGEREYEIRWRMKR
jgi:hypothetical protein